MDTNELFLACRHGDLSKVQQLVEQKEVDLNVRDKWDSTPLYYACLCGHEELVRYLLANDARCEANTFDGERCLYGALNNTIRNLLHNYKAVTASTMRRDLYIEFLRKLLERCDEYSDIEFVVRGERVAAHRCVLAARSPYFAQLLSTTWRRKSSVPVTSKVTPSVFRSLLQYLYTARLEISIDQVDDMISLARHCHLDHLESDLTDRMKRVASFECTKPGVKVTVVSVEPAANETQLQSHLSQLAHEAIPMGLGNQMIVELPFAPDSLDLFADVIICVENQQFRCHKVFFSGRSDYFKVLLKDSFNECHAATTLSSDESCNVKGPLDVITLQDISVETFILIIYYIYQDTCELTEQNVYDVLYKADLYLLPGLKRHCATVIGRLLHTYNVISVLSLSRLFSLSRLEDQCTEFIAAHLQQMLESAELRELVLIDARTVREREETDSIQVIDDVRYHVTSGVQTFSDMYEAEQKLAAIDRFLQELNLDA